MLRQSLICAHGLVLGLDLSDRSPAFQTTFAYLLRSEKDRALQPTLHLVSNSKWLILRAQPLLDNVLAIFPQLSGVLDTKAMIEHILDLLQAKTRDLGIKEVCIASLAPERYRIGKMKNLQIRTHPMPQIAA